MMKNEYDFSKMKSRKNPYAKILKQQISIRIHKETIDYFKSIADDTGIPYQNLMDLYLTECAHQHKKPTIKWT